jgi:predicted TIM-barrel fold metal-dependent hydrolase
VNDKIAIEEHFLPPGRTDLLANPGWPAEAWQPVEDALLDTGERRLALMDECGVAHAVLSLASDGIQSIVDPQTAIATAREANDALRDVVAAHPDRYSGFAALPMQDVAAASVELQRAVTELGFKGALVNGYSNLKDLNTALYYDDPIYDALWETMTALDVPLYLHPRNPLPDQRRIYEGRTELLGASWAFGTETAGHALRMITGGLFDRFPQLTVVLGHLGETLPFVIRRLEQRIAHMTNLTMQRPASHYLRENFWLTTSGNYHTPSVIGILLELGVERLVFAADYPFEEMHDGADWMDALPVSDRDRELIGRENVKRLLKL